MSTTPQLPTTLDQEIIRCFEPEIQAEMTDPERLAKIQQEFEEGFEVMKPVGPAVCVFGSARTRPGHPEYEQARRVGAGIARQHADRQKAHAIARGRRFERRLRQTLVRENAIGPERPHSRPFCSCGRGAGRRLAIWFSGKAALSLPTT